MVAPSESLPIMKTMPEHPKDVGDKTTLAVILALRMTGHTVLVPFGENARYDLVFDDGSRLARVQCKTGRLKQGAVRFNACSSYAHHRNAGFRERDYQGEIDYFAVHCPQTGGVYLIPIEDLRLRSRGSLRVAPARNNQRRGIRSAADYELGSVVLRRATAAPGARPGARGSFA
jgi:PD-(D/E)XK endonuclease